MNARLRLDAFVLPHTFVRDQCNKRITALGDPLFLTRDIAPAKMAATTPNISSITTNENTDPSLTADPFWDSTPRTISLPPELELMLSVRQVSVFAL